MKIKSTADGSTWFRCPICGRKLFKVIRHTQCRDFPAWCRGCKREILVNIDGQAIFAAASAQAGVS